MKKYVQYFENSIFIRNYKLEVISV